MAQAPSRCFTHTERTAVARCKQCHKPLCERCVKKMPGGIYCSDECYKKAASFQDRVERLDAQTKRGPNLGKLAVRLVILGVVIAILYYVFVSRGVRGVGDLIDLLKGLVP